MEKYNCKIVRSLKLKIEHCLLANPGAKLAGIKEDPAEEFSIGRMPYRHMPFSTARNTPSNCPKYKIWGRENILVQAIWEYAPSAPWQATTARVGKPSACPAARMARQSFDSPVDRRSS